MRDRPAPACRPAPVVLALALVLSLLVAACSTGSDRGEARLRGQQVEVMATWSETEQERFEQVLHAFERTTGVHVVYTSVPHDLPAVLFGRLGAGNPPDVAFLPQPGVLRELAAQGRLVPLDAATQDLVARHFTPRFRTLGSAGGHLFGVWFKSANKSLVWYRVADLERLGAVPPHDLTGLLALARRISASGTPAFAASGASAWTLTDWFENLYLRLAGADAYDALAAHRLPWTDPTVVRTLDVLAQFLAPDAVAGGLASAADMDFSASVEAVFGEPSRAAMVVEGDFVAGVITGSTSAVLGIDADVFPFPAGPDGTSVVVGGGDVAVQLRESAAGAALLQYLATPQAAAPWAAAGGFVSPNLDLDLSTYPDEVSRRVARQLLEAGDAFRFDLSDLQPASFGGTDDQGLFGELRRFLVERDATATAARLEAAATAAYAGAP